MYAGEFISFPSCSWYFNELLCPVHGENFPDLFLLLPDFFLHFFLIFLGYVRPFPSPPALLLMNCFVLREAGLEATSGLFVREYLVSNHFWPAIPNDKHFLKSDCLFLFQKTRMLHERNRVWMHSSVYETLWETHHLVPLLFLLLVLKCAWYCALGARSPLRDATRQLSACGEDTF